MWPQASPSPPTPASEPGPSAWGSVGQGFQSLGLSKRRGSLKLEARGRGLAARVGTQVTAGGAAGAALGGWSACQASKWEFFVFLKGKHRFFEGRRAPQRSQKGGFGTAGGAPWRVREIVGRRRELSGSPEGSGGRFWELWGAHLEALGTFFATSEWIFSPFRHNEAPASAE